MSTASRLKSLAAEVCNESLDKIAPLDRPGASQLRTARVGGADGVQQHRCRAGVATPDGTTFTSPANFNLKIEARDGYTGSTHEWVEIYWLKRNNTEIPFDEPLASQIYSENELPAGVYTYRVEGRAVYYDPLNGNERYKTIFPVPTVTITVVQGSGGISTPASTCTIPWGQSSCPVTINWSSNAPAAQVWMSALDNSGMQLVGQGQSGSIIAQVTQGGQRFHLRHRSATFGTTEARGVPTVNQTPTISIAAPVQGAVFASGASIPLSAAASDGDDGVSRVEFRLNGASLATVTSPPYSTRVSTLAPGSYALTAVATDTRGASTTSGTVNFTVSAIPGVSLSRRYVYDAQQRLCKTIEPETGATVMGYDEAGNMTWSAAGLDLPSTTSCDRPAAEASGRVVRRTYDARNRVATLRFPDHNGDVDYTYTLDGLVQQAVAYNDGGTTTATSTYQYNKRRLLTGEALAQTGFAPRTIGYGYSPNGHLAGQSYPSGLFIDYAPNAMGQATRAGTYATGVTYYPNGGIKQFTYGNGIVHTTIQNARRLPWRSVDGNILGLETTFDANGNVTALADLQLGAQYSRQMQYDDRDRLIAAGSPMFGGDGWHRFTYDALDNMRSWSLGGVKADQYWYDGKNRLSNVRNDSGATTVGLAYDLQGNLATKNGQGYAFDFGNRLRVVPGKASYRYDSRGLRTLSAKGQNSDEVSLYSEKGQLLLRTQQASGLQIESVYVAGRLLAELESGTGITTIKYSHTDTLGSPVATSSNSGQLLSRTQYDPYGKPLSGAVDGIGYTGHKMDADTSLTYMQHRYYDPTTASFLSVDPVGPLSDQRGHFNRYRYALNNPYTSVDPDGRQSVPLENRIGTSDPKAVQQYFNAQVGQLPTALDFVPVIGDVKGFVDAAREPTLVNFAAATIGLAGPLGDVAGKGLKNGRKVGDALGLEKMLASESQLADVMAGKGAVIAGSGSDTVLRDSPRLSAVHGGEQADWAKVTSSTHTASDGSKFATHAYQNTKTGLVVEPKTKLEKAPEDIE